MLIEKITPEDEKVIQDLILESLKGKRERNEPFLDRGQLVIQIGELGGLPLIHAIEVYNEFIKNRSADLDQVGAKNYTPMEIPKGFRTYR